MATREKQIRNINRLVRRHSGPKKSPAVFHLHYQIGEELTGNGRYGQTHSCNVTRHPNQTSVVKVISTQLFHSIERKKRGRYLRAVEDEMRNLQTVRHPNIVNVRRVFNEPDGIYVVADKVGYSNNSAGAHTLFDRLSSINVWSEQYIACIIKQVLRGLDYMHRLSDIHDIQ